MFTFKPELPYLEDKVNDLITHVFVAYNAISRLPLHKICRQDLANLKVIVEMLRSFHCAIAHNDHKKHENESRRTIWIEMHHTTFAKIRECINDLQDTKTSLDFTQIHNSLKELMAEANIFVQKVLAIKLNQNFYARVQFYKFHKKAIAVQCAVFHQYIAPLGNCRTRETEKACADLYRRAADLHDSFLDHPHFLHMPDEKIPHINFIPL